MSLTTLYATPTPKFDVADGRRASQQAVALARELGDRGAESKALWTLVNVNVFGGGDMREAVDAGERSLSLARELGEREQMAFTLNDLWRPYVAMGDLPAARRSLDEALPIWRELENLPMLAENLASAASLCRFAGDDDDALALAGEARDVAASIGNLWGQAYAAMNAYQIHLDRGEVGTAVTLLREAIDMGERAGFVAAEAPSAPRSARPTPIWATEPRAGHGGDRPEDRGRTLADGATDGSSACSHRSISGSANRTGRKQRWPTRRWSSSRNPSGPRHRSRCRWCAAPSPRPEVTMRTRSRSPTPCWIVAPRGPPDVRRGGHVAEGAGARRGRRDARCRRGPAGGAPDGRGPRAPADPVGDPRGARADGR